jgi:hypothetical protein
VLTRSFCYEKIIFSNNEIALIYIKISMKTKKTKSQRIEVRVSSDTKALIEPAAHERGVTLSAFATGIYSCSRYLPLNHIDFPL